MVNNLFVGLAATIGVIFGIILTVAVYIFIGFCEYRVLKILGYKNPWMAWVPFLNYYALGDVAADGRENLMMFGKELPAFLFKFWWIGSFVADRIPGIGGVLSTVIRILFLGIVLIEIYSRVENKNIEEVKVIGFVSAAITLIAYIKFLTYDKDLRVSTVYTSEPVNYDAPYSDTGEDDQQ